MTSAPLTRHHLALVVAVLFALLLALCVPREAQAQARAGGGSAGSVANDAAVAAARAQWQRISTNLLAAAEAVPQDKYAFKPTPDVRSFGQQFAHVAGAQNMICAAVLGDSARAEDDIEKTKTTKTDIVAALRASNEYCARAYALTDAQAMQRQIELFGMRMSALDGLVLNATHDGEHYGNVVTYLRLNGMVPPSSRGSR